MKTAILLGATGKHITGPVVRLPAGVWKVFVEGSYTLGSIIVNKCLPYPLDSENIVLEEHSDLTTQILDANCLTIRLERLH